MSYFGDQRIPLLYISYIKGVLSQGHGVLVDATASFEVFSPALPKP
jgi:hypothetical protein